MMLAERASALRQFLTCAKDPGPFPRGGTGVACLKGARTTNQQRDVWGQDVQDQVLEC